MGQFLKKVGVVLLADLVVYGVWTALENKWNGKDIFGRDIPEGKKFRTDWKGNIVLGSEDYQVV